MRYNKTADFIRMLSHSVVEQLLKLLVGVIDAQLLKAVHLEDLETGDIQDADEAGSLALGPVQGPVQPHHDPLEEPLVGGLGNGLHGELNLFLETEKFFKNSK